MEYIFLLQTTKFTKTAKENNRGKELFFTLRIIAGKYVKRVNNNTTSNKMNGATSVKSISGAKTTELVIAYVVMIFVEPYFTPQLFYVVNTNDIVNQKQKPA